MDSTIFIRNNRVLAVWLIAPLLVAVLAESGSLVFHVSQQGSYGRAQALDKAIPEMIAAQESFGRFIQGYEISKAEAQSIEDTCINLLNRTASAAGFKITSINLVQQRDAKSDVIKVSVNVSGTGPSRSMVTFLQQLKKQDPLIFEERIALTRLMDATETVKMDAQLGRIYIEKGVGL